MHPSDYAKLQYPPSCNICPAELKTSNSSCQVLRELIKVFIGKNTALELFNTMLSKVKDFADRRESGSIDTGCFFVEKCGAVVKQVRLGKYLSRFVKELSIS
jgi:hypothetical protein